MAQIRELEIYLDRLLDTALYPDYVVNGLQVEGRSEVRTLVSGVTASRALVDAAVDAGADAILVHHGYFWKAEDPRITGMKRKRLLPLLTHAINLIAYHLPLDGHREFGNNAQLAKELGISIEGTFGPKPQIAMHGKLPQPSEPAAFARHIALRLGREPLHIAGGPPAIHTVGWCSGAAQGYIEEAAALGLDAYLSGEVSEQTVHVAREAGIHFFAAGHHATERYGVAALGAHLAGHFGLQHRFIDIANPV